MTIIPFTYFGIFLVTDPSVGFLASVTLHVVLGLVTIMMVQTAELMAMKNGDVSNCYTQWV